MTLAGISILSADYMNFDEEISKIEQSEADFLHIDIMDGHFVPNITFGSEMVRQMNNRTDLFLDVHLMIESPEKYIKEFSEAGADMITFHYEAVAKQSSELIELIHSYGVKAGIAINPYTDIEIIKPYIHSLDLILQMTVQPGFGGQKFIEDTLKNMNKLSEWKNKYDLPFDIEVDGGINSHSAEKCKESGVTALVLGSAFFNEKDKKALISKVQSL